jgi:hypothetical protein
MKFNVAVSAAVILAAAIGLSVPVQAGTCQSVKAKGVAKTVALATLYAQEDLQQTARSLKGRVTQATTNCNPTTSGEYRCKIEAVVCPK